MLRACVLMLCVGALPAGAQGNDRNVPLPRYTNLVYPTVDVDLDPIPPTTASEVSVADADGTSAPALSLERRPSAIAIAFVVDANVAWMRTDVAGEDDLDARRGLAGLDFVHGVLRGAVWTDAADGSTLTIVTYDDAARLVLPPTSLRRVPTSPLGRAEDFSGSGEAPSTGIRLAIDTLQASTAPRKLVVVVGNGVASDAGTEAAAMTVLAQRAHDLDIELAAIVFDGWATEPRATRALLAFTPKHRTARTVGEGVHALGELLRTASVGYRARFDLSRFAWNGELHSLRLRAGEVWFVPTGVFLPDRGDHPRPSPWRWPLVGLAVVVLALLVKAGRPARAP